MTSSADPAQACPGAPTGRDGWIVHDGPPAGRPWLPRALEFIAPTWMLRHDGVPSCETSSWKLPDPTLPPRIAEAIGVDPGHVGYSSPAGAGLDLGMRLLRAGWILRRRPYREPAEPVAGSAPSSPLPLEDEIRFLRRFYPGKWAAWAVARMASSGMASPGRIREASRRARVGFALPEPLPHAYPDGFTASIDRSGWNDRVTVLLPTLDRYEYLDRTLDGIARQTVRPREIVCIDQSLPEIRRDRWPDHVGDVPLRVIVRDIRGQCSSRNAGLQVAEGDHILFLDDDIELPDDLVEIHIRCLVTTGADASCGVAEELGAGDIPASFRRRRLADVFPTNNTLLRRDALAGSGLFDMAFERGERADHDIGTRLFLSGAALYLNPDARILHYHAPRGGLRTHGARVVTRAASRRSLTVRHLPAPTQIYLWRRYFPASAVREAVRIARISALGSDERRGWRKALRAGLGIAAWPRVSATLRRNDRAAAALLAEHPTIPPLDPATVGPAASGSTGSGKEDARESS